MGDALKDAVAFTEQAAAVREDLARVEDEFGRRIVGNRDTLRFVLKALLSSGHILFEGVPGVGKTLMVRTLSELLDLVYRRVQFTPDLMPADIVGTNIILEGGDGGRRFRFEEGPIFTNILLADEINRASPKTQSALLQAMEEREVTVFGKTYPLDDVFFTLATQNPIEMAGTYPLPEAQLDRFFFKLVVPVPDLASLTAIARLNATAPPWSSPVDRILSRDRLLAMRRVISQVPITDRIYDAAARLVHATHPGHPQAPEEVRRFVKYGASPRGLIALLAASRVSAVMDGRVNLAIEDLEENFLPAVRHRLVMRFEGEVEGVTVQGVLAQVLAAVLR